VEPLKLVIFHLMHFADIVRCVAFCKLYYRLYLIIESLNGFLMSQRQMNLKDAWAYNVRKLHRPRMSDAFLADIVDMI